MTRKFNVHYCCDRCGSRTTAETGFGRWMRNATALDSVEGIVRTDADHIVLRYKTYPESGGKPSRDFQLMMVVEVKEYGAEPDKSQTDILSFFRQMVEDRGQNMHGCKTHISRKLKSPMQGRLVTVRFCGVHLLQFEKTNPDDSRWIKWDRKPIDGGILTGILAMERNPEKPSQFMSELLRDRHRKDENAEFSFFQNEMNWQHTQPA